MTQAHPIADRLVAPDALETLFGRRVDLLDRAAIEASRNPIRRRRILADARPLHAA
jgi:predicted nucleotidyltransferase